MANEVRALPSGQQYYVDSAGIYAGLKASDPVASSVAATGSNIITTVDNPVGAGQPIKPGDNPEIDAEISSGKTGLIVNSDGNYQSTDGVVMTSSGESSKNVDISKASATDLANIKIVAEAQFLAITSGGYGSDELTAAQNALGIAGNTNLKDELLSQAGYTQHTPETFFDGVGGYTGSDAGVQLLVDRYKDKPTDADFLAAGLDPADYRVTDSNLASSYYVEENLGGGSTNAVLGSSYNVAGGGTGGIGSGNYSSSGSTFEGGIRDAAARYRSSQGLGKSDNRLDIYEWDLVKKKLKEKEEITGTNVNRNRNIQKAPSFINLGQGAPLAPQAVPLNVTQQVTPPSYFNQPIGVQGIGDARSGTFSKPLQTAGLSAVPKTASYKTHYAGTQGLVDSTLTAPVGGGAGPQQVVYRNDLGQEMVVTEVSGQPVTYVPPGFDRIGTYADIAQQQQQVAGMAQGGAVRGYASGGDVALIKIAQMNGFKGDDLATARSFMNASEGLRNKVTAMGALMNQGGMVQSFDEGGVAGHAHPHDGWISATEQEQLLDLEIDPASPTDQFEREQADRNANLIEQTMQPMQAPVSYIQPQAADFIPVDAGQTLPIAPYAEAATVGTVQQAELPTATPTFATVSPEGVASDVATEAAKLTAAQGTVSDAAQAEAAQQLTSSVTGMNAAQGESVDVVAPAPRDLQTGELIDPVANAASAAEFTEQIKAETATPTAKATVQGQLEGLMQQFEGGNTPAWAAGSMRNATAMLAARGLAASSMAGQAIIQATMEAALPIAQLDAQVNAQFEGQNLSNRQARAMLSAQQRATFMGQEFDQAFQARVQNSARIGDIANMNFTAEQNIAMENARAANTMSLNNLSNRQAMVMAEAAALSNLDIANLNNRQQAAVQNAQSFLQMDMANLDNDQQTAIFKSQQNVQALFTDQAAENAAEQFNASSENQTNQFFANLSSQTSQFNASQQNAMDQFNVNSVNALREFNSEIQQQRDLFNAQNGLVIAQSNAQWRQNLSTLNTSAQNESNMDFAKTMTGFTARNLDSYWQTERDLMSFAFQTENNNADRATSIALQSLKNEGDSVGQSSSSIFSKLVGKLAEKVFLPLI